MAKFGLLEFTLCPTKEQFDCCRKADLAAIMGFFKMVIPVDASKREIKQVLQDELVTQGIRPESGDLSDIVPCPIQLSTMAGAKGQASWLCIDPSDPGSPKEDILLTICVPEL